MGVTEDEDEEDEDKEDKEDEENANLCTEVPEAVQTLLTPSHQNTSPRGKSSNTY